MKKIILIFVTALTLNSAITWASNPSGNDDTDPQTHRLVTPPAPIEQSLKDRLITKGKEFLKWFNEEDEEEDGNILLPEALAFLLFSSE